MDDTKGVAAALGVSVNAQVDARRQVVFQTHIAQDTPQKDLDELLDGLNASIDRQVAFYQIEELENSLERDKQILYSIQHNMQEVEANMRQKYEASERRQPFKMSQTEVVQKKQAEDNVKRQTEIVKLAERRLAEAKEKAGKRDGSPSPANR